MSLNDTEVQRQIRHMVAFIDQEANEKVEEIDAKTEEEFQIEKSRLVQEQRQKIMEYYVKKEKQIELTKKIQNSNLSNQARLKVLECRQNHIKDVLIEAGKRLSEITSDKDRYRQTLKGLMIQGMYQLLEKDIIIRCRQEDADLVEELAGEASAEYQTATNRKVELMIDRGDFLSPEISGGVELNARYGRMRVVNTLESRLEQLSYQMIPEIRHTLFGANPNRRFLD